MGRRLEVNYYFHYNLYRRDTLSYCPYLLKGVCPSYVSPLNVSNIIVDSRKLC